MRRFTEAGRSAIANKNWYAALALSLIIPEICASLEDPGPGRSRKRYTDWCKKWLEPKFTSEKGGWHTPTTFLSAEDCYQARCSIIHSGSAEIDPKSRGKIDRFEFFSDGPHMSLVRGMVYNNIQQPDFLQLRVDMFSETVFVTAEDWDDAMVTNVKVQAEKAKLLVIHPPGKAVGGIVWG